MYATIPSALCHDAAVELTTTTAVLTCLDSHRRLLETVSGLDDATARRPSRLPDWTVGHVLTHIARNADGHIRRLTGALRGEDLVRYPGGQEQRDDEIADGAGRPAAELVADVRTSAERLEAVWQQLEEAGWPGADLYADDNFPVSQAPARRLREVEVHHVDLGLGYEPDEWPAVYMHWELHNALQRLPERLEPSDARRFLAWLLNRNPLPDGLELRSWES